MIKCIGMTVLPRASGFDLVKVYSDLSFRWLIADDSFVYPTLADAIRDGRSMARAHKIVFRTKIGAFKSLIKEDSSDA